MYKFKIPEGCKEDPTQIPNKQAYKFSIGELKKRADTFDVAVDIGAHVGTMTRLMSNDFNEIQSFEPVFWDYLEYNTKDLPSVNINKVGLGNVAKEEEIFLLDRNTGGSSIVKHQKRKWQDTAPTQTIKIETLDSFNLSNVGFIKIDVESYEYFVIDGAKETLLNNNPIVMIEYLDRYKHPEFPPEKTNELFESLGYNKIRSFGKDHIYAK